MKISEFCWNLSFGSSVQSVACSCYCCTVLKWKKVFSAPPPSPPVRGPGCTRSWDRTQDRWPQVTTGIFQSAWCWAQHIKPVRRKRKEGTIRVTVLVFPSHHYMCWSPAFLGIAEHHGKWWVNSLFCFVCVHGFCFTHWTAFISTHELSHSFNFLLHPTVVVGGAESEQKASWG